MNQVPVKAQKGYSHEFAAAMVLSHHVHDIMPNKIHGDLSRILLNPENRGYFPIA